MLRSILCISFAMCLLAASIGSQAPRRVDINLATVTELLTLPGVNPEIAKQIVSNRPYSKAEDLHRAGLANDLIRSILPLIEFGHDQLENPGPPGGAVAMAPPPLE